MPIPYNCFGAGGHRRWIVVDGGTWNDSNYCWTDKLVPTADDWYGPFTFPQLPDLGANGMNMSQIEYDPDRDMFMIVGTLEGIDDPGQPNAYPNWSPYVLRSFDLMDSWESDEIPLHVEWSNVEPGLWGGFSVGHLHYDPYRRRMYMLGGLTFSAGYSRPDTASHVSYSDDGGTTWTSFADQRQDPADDFGWGNTSWFIHQRRPPHFPLAQGNVVAACGFVVARRGNASNDWLISLGDPPDFPGTDNNYPIDFPGDPGSTAAWNRIDRDFWSVTPIPGNTGWFIGNQNTVSSTDQLGSLMYTASPTLSIAFWNYAIPDSAIVVAVDNDTAFEGHRYTGASGDPGGNRPIRHVRTTIANGRLWSHTGFAGATEENPDVFISTASPLGAFWRRDQDFRLSSLAPVDAPGGVGEFTQHPFFDLSAWTATGAVHHLAQNKQDPSLLMCVGRIANASRYSGISDRFTCYSMSEDGGLSWSPPMQLPSGMHQPFYVWSV